ncbi:MAG: prephenate dehydratase [Micrococcales bacterium]|nr:prephenate dehydratase [Micrococcales bacterium]
MERIGYLGPAGTFSEVALRSRPESRSASAEPYGSVDAALGALREGQIDGAVVPIENSIEGGVPATLDSLAVGEPLRVVGEMVIPVTFVLAARPGTALGDIEAVSTHPHGWAQVRRFVAQRLPGARFIPSTSTAAAAVDLARGADTWHAATAYQGAVCHEMVARDHGLEILASDIGDNKAAVTRFVLVARPGSIPAPTGADKTSVVLFQKLDHPGGLMGLLEQFAVRGINLTRLESRPTGESLGQYCFSVDLEGHLHDARVAEALMGLHRVCAEVRFLGSYPTANGRSPAVGPAHDRPAYDEAQAWLRGLNG